MNDQDVSMGSRDEEEQRPLTISDIRALLDEQEERINAAHQEEIKLQEKRINAAHQEEMRLLLEATDRRFENLERASTSLPPPQDAANEIAEATQNDEILPLRTGNHRASNTQFAANLPRRRESARFSLLLFQQKRNEGDSGEDEAGDDSSEGLEEDTFSIMMLNKPFREIPFCHPALLPIISVGGFVGFMFVHFKGIILRSAKLYWSLFVTFSVMMLGPFSGPWQLSMFTLFFLQLWLGFLIFFDLTLIESEYLGCRARVGACDFFHVPMGTNAAISMAQYLTVFFALVMQNDIFSSLQTLSKLRNADNVPWDEVIGKKGNRTWRLWAWQILLPNVLKFTQAAVVMFVTFIVIIRNTRIVDLLKDFTALFVVSEADNIMFHVANMGYFGENLRMKTEEVKSVQWMIMEEESEQGDVNEEEEKKLHHSCCNCSLRSCSFLTLAMAMMGGLTYFVVGQYNGRYVKMEYPKCHAPRPQWVGNQNCIDLPPYNTAECGWDGGDCPEPTEVEGYINCTVSFPQKLGDGVCDDAPPYNTEMCGFDGMDCIIDKVVVDGYPECLVRRPEWIRDGMCHDFAPYNTPECGYDGGDCDPPQ